MSFALIIAVAVALGADAFSVALALGITGINKGMVIRLSLIVALFHVIMPLTGLWVGESLGHLLGHLANVIGGLVLLWLGGRMIWRVARPKTETYSFQEGRKLINRAKLPAGASLTGFGPYLLAASVSMDALSVGFSLGTYGTNVALTVLTMGVTAGLMTGSGLVLGKLLGSRTGDKAELLGGTVLFLIGLRLMF